MSIRIYLLLLLALPCARVNAQLISYKRYKNSFKLYEKALQQSERKEYGEALESYKKLQKFINFRPSGYQGAARCYMALYKPQRALRQLKKSFLHGYPLKYLQENNDSVFYSAIWPAIISAYPTLRAKYLSTIDTVLLRELLAMEAKDQAPRQLIGNPTYAVKKDSLIQVIAEVDEANIKRLKKVEQQHGWPGDELLGNRFTLGEKGFDASIFVVHASERDNLYFLASAKKAAKKNKALWREAESIMGNLLYRFRNKDGYLKLRHTYVKQNGRLNLKKSYFQLFVLAETLQNNPHLATEFFVAGNPAADQDSNKSLKKMKALHQIKDFLVKEGIHNSRIIISEKVQLLPTDELGRHAIVYRRTRINQDQK